MNTSDATYDRNRFIAEFIGCDCYESACSPSEYDESISEIQNMIDYSIESGNEKEVAEWRKELQKTKVAKRRAKRMIESNNRMEIALT